MRLIHVRTIARDELNFAFLVLFRCRGERSLNGSAPHVEQRPGSGVVIGRVAAGPTRRPRSAVGADFVGGEAEEDAAAIGATQPGTDCVAAGARRGRKSRAHVVTTAHIPGRAESGHEDVLQSGGYAVDGAGRGRQSVPDADTAHGLVGRERRLGRRHVCAKYMSNATH